MTRKAVIVRGFSRSTGATKVTFPDVTIALQGAEDVSNAASHHVSKDIEKQLQSAPAPWSALGRSVSGTVTVRKGVVEFPYGSSMQRMEDHGAVDFEPRDEPMEKAVSELLDATMSNRPWRPS